MQSPKRQIRNGVGKGAGETPAPPPRERRRQSFGVRRLAAAFTGQGLPCSAQSGSKLPHSKNPVREVQNWRSRKGAKAAAISRQLRSFKQFTGGIRCEVALPATNLH